MNGPNNYDEWDEQERNRKPPSFKGPKIDKETGDPGPRKPPKMDRITGKVVAPTSDVKPGAVKSWLADKGTAAADVFAKLAKNTPGSVHQGVDYNKNIASTAGETKDPYQVINEGYSGGMKSSEGPQTTLLRGIETEPKKKKKNKNYEDY